MCGFAHSSDTFFYQVAGMLGIDRLAYWAHEFGFGPRPASTFRRGRRDVPTNQWKLDTLGQPIFPGEVYQAGIGQGYDVVTPIQLINAYAALANGGTLYQPQIVHDIKDPTGKIVQPFTPKVIRKLESRPRCSRRCARRPATSSSSGTPTTSWTCRSSWPASRARPSSASRDSKGRLPFHSWFVAFVPKDPP